MEHNRCFTQEELNKMLVRPVDAAVAAVEAGDVAEAELWIDKMYKAALRSFTLRKNWDRGLTDKIYEKQGVEGIAEVMKNRHFTEAELEKYLVTPEYIQETVAAVRAGDKVTYELEIVEMDDKKHDITCAFTGTRQDGVVCLKLISKARVMDKKK